MYVHHNVRNYSVDEMVGEWGTFIIPLMHGIAEHFFDIPLDRE